MPEIIRNPFLEEIDDPILARALIGSTEELAAATQPSFLENPGSPITWGAKDWEAMEAGREDLFDWSAVEAQFDYDTFLRDGYAVLRGVMTPETIEAWTEAVQVGQRINDALLRADWKEIDWLALGRTEPDRFLSTDEIDRAIGGSQKAPQSTDEAGVLTLRINSVFCEYFPAGHVPYLMNVLTHPQMLALQRMCLDSDEIYFDHSQLLTRPPGYPGGNWHSHRIGGGYDDGTASLEVYRAQPNAILNLCYPQGFDADLDGGLKIVRGSHLFRDPERCRAPSDEEMEQGWLKDRLHPVTNEPLEIERLSLEPGSVCCCLSHAAHAVAPKAQDRSTRWCSLYCYKKPHETGEVQPPHAVPPVWAMKAQRGELPETLIRMFRHSFDRELTQHRKVFDDA